MSEQTPEPEQPDRTQVPQGAVRVRVRRAPRYRPFTVTGALVGLAAGIVVSLVFGTSSDRFSAPVLIGYLAVIGLLVGGVLGAAVAVLSERSAGPRRR